MDKVITVKLDGRSRSIEGPQGFFADIDAQDKTCTLWYEDDQGQHVDFYHKGKLLKQQLTFEKDGALCRVLRDGDNNLLKMQKAYQDENGLYHRYEYDSKMRPVSHYTSDSVDKLDLDTMFETKPGGKQREETYIKGRLHRVIEAKKTADGRMEIDTERDAKGNLLKRATVTEDKEVYVDKKRGLFQRLVGPLVDKNRRFRGAVAFVRVSDERKAVNNLIQAIKADKTLTGAEKKEKKNQAAKAYRAAQDYRRS